MSIEIAKKVFAKTAQSKIILTPEAYRLWFVYFTEENPALNEEMNEILSSAVFFSKSITERLYQKYFQKETDSQMIDQVHQETQKIIKGIFSELLDGSKLTNEYGSNMERYAQQLNSATELPEVQQIVKGIIKETSAMAENSHQLESKLKDATAQTDNLKKQLEVTEKDALTDALTGINNRKAFDKTLGRFIDTFKKENKEFCVVLFDIDHFKNFNDTYGHKTGDYVLEMIGGILHDCVQGADFPARYGGEEFVVLLAETSLDKAVIVAERIRMKIFLKKPVDPSTGMPIRKISASFGVSLFNDRDNTETVVERADKALYLAKESGRNNVKYEGDLSLLKVRRTSSFL